MNTHQIIDVLKRAGYSPRRYNPDRWVTNIKRKGVVTPNSHMRIFIHKDEINVPFTLPYKTVLAELGTCAERVSIQYISGGEVRAEVRAEVKPKFVLL